MLNLNQPIEEFRAKFTEYGVRALPDLLAVNPGPRLLHEPVRIAATLGEAIVGFLLVVVVDELTET